MIRECMHAAKASATLGIFWTLTACGGGTTTSSNSTDGGASAQQDAGTETHDSGGTGSPSDSGATSDAGTSHDAATSASTLSIKIPANFTGTTRQLSVVVEAQLPPAGPPAGILYQANSPVLVAGQKLDVALDATGISGDYFVLVVLYMQGGGNFSPKSGVDYQVATTAKVHFDGGAHNLGELDLVLAP
jgi:hypothetical protein